MVLTTVIVMIAARLPRSPLGDQSFVAYVLAGTVSGPGSRPLCVGIGLRLWITRPCRRTFCDSLHFPVMLAFLAAVQIGLSTTDSAPRPLAELAHTAWTVRDGAPGAVRGLAQGVDGVLWLATELGLFQFDGMRFERFEPPPGQTLSPRGTHILLALPDTSLWIGHFTSGVTVLQRGRLISYDTRDGLPTGTVTAIARDSAGTMWVSTTRGLARLRGNRWEEIGPAVGYPGGYTEPILVDARGWLWAVSEDGIYVLRREAARFEKREVPAVDRRGPRPHWLALAPDGSIWGVQRPLGLFLIADARGDSPRAFTLAYADTSAFAVTFARGHPALVTPISGRLVQVRLPAATGSSGAATPRPPNAVEAPFSRAAGMSGDRISAALYDREGTLWIGTPTGVDRFRQTKLTPVVWPRPVNWPGIAADTNGVVWVAARNAAPAALFVIGGRVVTQPNAPGTLTCIYRDLHGGIWVGGEYRLWERKGDALAPVPLPSRLSAVKPGSLPIHAIARDRDDRLWVSIATDGVYRQRAEGGWERFDVRHGLGRAVATAITTDSGGRTWLGYASGDIALVGGDSVRVFTAADGLGVGGVLAITVRGDRVWIAGQLGVAAFAPREAAPAARPFVPLHMAGEPLRGVSGVVETGEGELWLNGADGVTRIAAGDVRRALADSGYRAPYERLDYHDGIEPPAPQIRPLPSAIEGTDGRLWFTSAGGVSWIDPRRVRRNSVPPTVKLRTITVAGHRYLMTGNAEDTIHLPPRTAGLSVAYTAYSLAVPERVRFKHRLDGLDTAWQDVGGRREAFYTNLRPGPYRFRVMAANDDGVWNEAGTSLSFDVLPAWYQTIWFRALVVLLIGGLGAMTAALVQHGRHLRSQSALRAQYEATLAERARIAQDLHDTLLQGFAGVTLQLKRAELALPEQPDVAAETIMRVQQLARASLREARERVWDMRETRQPGDDLPAALDAVAREQALGSGIDVFMTTTGHRRSLPRPVEDAAFRIGREAVVNAIRHAEPRRIEIHVEFHATTVRVEVRDDGRGTTPDAVEKARKQGHFGLSGARERATRLGGTCDVRARPEGGTILALELPLAERATR